MIMAEMKMAAATTDHNWTKKHIDILKEWKARCFVYLWLHDKSSYYYTCVQNYLSYPVIIFSSIASATLLSSTNDIARYCVGGLSLISGILTGVMQHLKPGELLQAHMYSTRKYHALIRNIDACLSIAPSMRPIPDMFIEKIGAEIDVMLANQIDPPTPVITEFENKYGSLACILYGEDIIELISTEIATSKMFTKFKRHSTLQDDMLDTNTTYYISDRRNGSIDIRHLNSIDIQPPIRRFSNDSRPSIEIRQSPDIKDTILFDTKSDQQLEKITSNNRISRDITRPSNDIRHSISTIYEDNVTINDDIDS